MGPTYLQLLVDRFDLGASYVCLHLPLSQLPIRSHLHGRLATLLRQEHGLPLMAVYTTCNINEILYLR